jgi:hypothetical protein
MVCSNFYHSREFRGFRLSASDRYGPLGTARWLTKQSNEQSNAKKAQLKLAVVDYSSWFNPGRLHESSATPRPSSSRPSPLYRTEQSLDG